MLINLKFGSCIFFTSVFILTAPFSAHSVTTETVRSSLSSEDTVAVVVTLLDDEHLLSAFYLFKMIFSVPIVSRSSARKRVQIARAIFRSAQWNSLPVRDRLEYLRIFLGRGPVTARIQRELVFLAASVDAVESVDFLMDYKRSPWTEQYLDGDDMPSLLPQWKVMWSALRRGPVSILKGQGFVSYVELSELIYSKVCESSLSTSVAGRRSGNL